MKQFIFKNYKSAALLLLIFSLLVYIILRAYKLSITHDEALSLLIVLGDKGLARIANNHFINTGLMYVCYHIFGGQEIWLRLPNVLAFILYSFFAYKILIKAENFFLMLIGAAFLFFNPYMLDFFSLARGYGLSLGFGLGSVYYLFRQNSFSNYKEYISALSLSLFFSLLASYANMVCINLNVALLAIFFIELFLLVKNKNITLNKKEITILAGVIIINFLFLAVLVQRIQMLEATNELYFGGHENFIDNTLTTLLGRSFYFSEYGELFFLRTRLLIILFFAGVVIYQLYNKKHSPSFKITILLLLIIFANIVQHYALDSLYPIERTTTILVPLFGLLVYYLAADIYKEYVSLRAIKFLFNIILLLICLPLGIHLTRSLNLHYTKEWKDNADVKDVMKIVMIQHTDPMYNGRKINISNSWYFEPLINYYRILYKMDYLEPSNRDGASQHTDFTYCSIQDRYKLPLQNGCYIILQDNDDIETVLIKKSPCK